MSMLICADARSCLCDSLAVVDERFALEAIVFESADIDQCLHVCWSDQLDDSLIG
eukprot:m.568483 g.568483  ORF g.568483 m.568483 type:complete len:55 (+) comp57838_c0_seq136:904-1068(+)